MDTDAWANPYWHEGELGTNVPDYPLPNPVGFIHFKDKNDRPEPTQDNEVSRRLLQNPKQGAEGGAE